MPHLKGAGRTGATLAFGMSARITRIRELAARISPDAVQLRRTLHRQPEIGWQEFETTEAVTTALAAVGIPTETRSEGTGLVADIGSTGPMVGFRADLDALPIQELNETPYVSQRPGLMHACGHDAHTAIGVGIALVLNELDLPGRARMVFQPAEEMVPGGAMVMRREGVGDGVAAMIAFHVDPTIPAGSVGLRTGPITGAADRVTIRLSGPGGHTSRPHQAVDLIYAAARVVTDLPAMMRHTIDPRQTALVVFGRVAGGVAANVIPTEVELGGTFRLFDLDLWHSMPQLIEKLVQDIVTPLGAKAHIDYRPGSPPVDNDAAVISVAEEAAHAALGAEATHYTHQSLGAEDFAWFLEDMPGALIRLGASLPDRRVDLHSATFDIDERAIETGIIVGSEMLVQLMEHLAR